jgi:hypothetical protein
MQHNRHKVVNTFGGLDTDTSVNKYPPDSYVECKNFRVLLNEEHGSHSLVNVKGRNEVVRFHTHLQNPNFKIIGIGEFIDSVVIFVFNANTNRTIIYHIPKERFLEPVQLGINVNMTGGYSVFNRENETFGFNINSKLVVLCRKETENIKRVYFTDGTQPLRSINVLADLTNADPNTFLLIPNVTYSQIDTKLVSGSLLCGKVGYAYQLYNLYGSESHFSPVSSLTDLYPSPVGALVKNTRGGVPEQNSGKGINVTINNLDNRFNRVRLVRVLYGDISVPPKIELILESPFSNNFIYTDVGVAAIDTFAVEEFNELLISPIPQTLEVKNNHLFIGNVKEEFSDIDLSKVIISYEEGVTNHILDYYTENTSPFGNLSNEYFLDNIPVGYQRRERYRLGIVGFDEKMRPTFIQPINNAKGDIIFSDFNDVPLFEKILLDGKQTIKINILHPKLKINAIPERVKYIQIVRVARTAQKRSVIDMGIASHLVKEGAVGKELFFPHIRSKTQSSLDPTERKILDYASPEVSINKTHTIKSSKLDIIGRYQRFKTYVGASRVFIEHSHNPPISLPRTLDIDDQTFLPFNAEESNTTTLLGRQIVGQVRQVDDNGIIQPGNTNNKASKGSTLLLGITNPEPDFFGSLLCRRRQNVNGNIPVDFYGELESNEYVPCSGIYKVTNGEINNGQFIDVFGGDTYIGFFEHLRGIWNYETFGNNTFISSEAFIVESTINLPLQTNDTLNSLTNKLYVFNSPVRAMREDAGEHPVDDKTNYRQDFNLYTYNSVYSRHNNVKTYFTKPADIDLEKNIPHRIYYSDKKVNGEFSDSWTKIRPGNFVDLDSKYGSLTRLYNFRDTLFTLQEKGISVIPVEQRELVSTSSLSPLMVGLGDITAPPQYLSTETGVLKEDYYSVINSRAALYFYDRSLRKIGMFNGEQVMLLSDIQNISSLAQKVDKPVISYFDPSYNEVIFNFMNGKSLVFNEYKQKFSGEYGYNIEHSFTNGKNSFTFEGNKIYHNNQGDYAKFYDNIFPQESSVTMLINPQGNQVVLYDILELTLEMFKGTPVYNKPPYSIQMWNEWQDSGEIILENDVNIFQRFRTWRMTPLVDNTEDEGRMRSSSLFVKIKFKNDNNEKVVLHDLITNIRPIRLR